MTATTNLPKLQQVAFKALEKDLLALVMTERVEAGVGGRAKGGPA